MSPIFSAIVASPVVSAAFSPSCPASSAGAAAGVAICVALSPAAFALPGRAPDESGEDADPCAADSSPAVNTFTESAFEQAVAAAMSIAAATAKPGP